MNSNKCDYEFIPSDWESETGKRSPLDKPWECHRTNLDEHKKCIFHADIDKKNDQEVQKQLEKLILNGDEKDRILIGAKFGDVDLDNKSLDSDFKSSIDLRHSKFFGDLSMTKTNLSRGFEMDFSIFNGSVNLSDSEFSARISFRGCEFQSSVRLSESVFENPINFSQSYFSEGTLSLDRSRFSHDVYFDDTQFDCNEVSFTRAIFGGDAEFSHARFNTVSNFTAAIFKNIALFRFVSFRDASFRRVTFERNARFVLSNFVNANFENSTIKGRLLFALVHVEENAIFRNIDTSNADFRLTDATRANFRYARFRHHVSFFAARFHESANFSNTKFQGGAIFEMAELNMVRFSKAVFKDVARFGWMEAYEARFTDTRFIDDVEFLDVLTYQIVLNRAVFEKGGNLNQLTTEIGSFLKTNFMENISFNLSEFTIADFRQAEFVDVQFELAKFNSIALFSWATFRSVDFSKATFDAYADFESTTFNRANSFDRVSFNGFARFFDIEVNTDIHFSHSTFSGGCTFLSSKINKAYFHGTEFFEQANFSKTTFELVDFSSYKSDMASPHPHSDTIGEPGQEFWIKRPKDHKIEHDTDWEQQKVLPSISRSSVRSSGAKFHCPVYFPRAVINEGIFSNIHFLKDAVFTDATFNAVVFSDSVFDDVANFARANVAEFATFVDTECFDLRLTDVDFQGKVQFDEAITTSDYPIDLTGAHLSEGGITQPDENEAFFDFSRATIGTVDLIKGNSERPLFSYFRIYETDFDEFDFEKYCSTENAVRESDHSV